MNKQEFIESLKIERINDGDFGHHPSQLVSIAEDGSTIIAAITNNGVAEKYKIAKLHLENSKTFFMSLDFLIDDDFIAVISMENGEFSIMGIPYSPETGERFPIVESVEILDVILDQFKIFIK